jgi:hypothetical protein
MSSHQYVPVLHACVHPTWPSQTSTHLAS